MLTHLSCKLLRNLVMSNKPLVCNKHGHFYDKMNTEEKVSGQPEMRIISYFRRFAFEMEHYFLESCL